MGLGIAGSVPLQTSLWPRGRTLVSGWRRRFSSAVVAAAGTSTGMVRPANLTRTVMVGGELSMASVGLTPHNSVSVDEGLKREADSAAPSPSPVSVSL